MIIHSPKVSQRCFQWLFLCTNGHQNTFVTRSLKIITRNVKWTNVDTQFDSRGSNTLVDDAQRVENRQKSKVLTQILFVHFVSSKNQIAQWSFVTFSLCHLFIWHAEPMRHSWWVLFACTREMTFLFAVTLTPSRSRPVSISLALSSIKGSSSVLLRQRAYSGLSNFKAVHKCS